GLKPACRSATTRIALIPRHKCLGYRNSMGPIARHRGRDNAPTRVFIYEASSFLYRAFEPSAGSAARLARPAPNRSAGGYPAFPRFKEVPPLESENPGCCFAGDWDRVPLDRSTRRSPPLQKGRDTLSQPGPTE